MSTTNPAEILKMAEIQGVRIETIADKMRIHGQPSQELIWLLTEHKAAILRHLAGLASVAVTIGTCPICGHRQQITPDAESDHYTDHRFCRACAGKPEDVTGVLVPLVVDGAGQRAVANGCNCGRGSNCCRASGTRGTCTCHFKSRGVTP